LNTNLLLCSGYVSIVGNLCADMSVLYSGNLHTYHWVALNISRIQMLSPVDFRFQITVLGWFCYSGVYCKSWFISFYLCGHFQRNVYGAWEQYLGLEHPDTTPKRVYAANQVKNMSSKYRKYQFWIKSALPTGPRKRKTLKSHQINLHIGCYHLWILPICNLLTYIIFRAIFSIKIFYIFSSIWYDHFACLPASALVPVKGQHLAYCKEHKIELNWKKKKKKRFCCKLLMSSFYAESSYVWEASEDL
jgi:hypothetical protein